MRVRFLAVGVAALIAAVVPSMGKAATPEGATVDADNPRAEWSGGPFLANSPRCTSAVDPLCDHFSLTIGEHVGHQSVTIEVVADDAANDVDFELYNGRAFVAGSSLRGRTDRVTVFDLRPGTYEVRVLPIRASGGTYSGSATFTPLESLPSFATDGAKECLEAVPAEVGVAGVTDDGEDITLDILVLMDSGVPLEDAQKMIAVAQEKSYAAVGVTLNATYEAVSFPSDGDVDAAPFGGIRGTATGERLIQDTKNHVAGWRPDGIDVVYTVTNKDLYKTDVDQSTDYGLLGQADCIGGVRYGTASFAVGEWIEGDSFTLAAAPGVFRLLGNLTAKTMAHEVGHVLGAHHHYGNCAQALSEDDVTLTDVAPCSLMFPDATTISHEFGTLESVVVRGHVARHA